MRTRIVAPALLVTLACSDWNPPTDPTDPNRQALSSGKMSAWVEDTPWDSWSVTARILDGFLVIEGWDWDTDESYSTIKLSLKAEANTHLIGPGTMAAADVSYRPTYDFPQGWSASGVTGSGTITITSLTNSGARGTFEFTAKALSQNSLPADYRVTRGVFDVTF